MKSPSLKTLASRFEGTEYHVHSEPAFTLRVGVHSPELAALHRKHSTSCSLFVTAHNPLGRLHGDIENWRSQTELIDVLKVRGFSTVLGSGKHPAGAWPAEPSVLVLGASRDYAAVLAKRYNQLAVLCMGPEAVPEVVFFDDRTLSPHAHVAYMNDLVAVVCHGVREGEDDLAVGRMAGLHIAMNEAVGLGKPGYD